MSSTELLRLALLVPLGLMGLVYAVLFVRSLAARSERWWPNLRENMTGFITVFFDTFGIGSFATTTSLFRAMRLVPDELIPGTLNVGHTLSSVVGAFIFIELVPVAPLTLVSMILAAMFGAWFGAGIVSRLPRRSIRFGMGICLLAASGLMLLSATGAIPGGGDALALGPVPLVVAVVANFVFGSLMTLGIGLYAPCMITISLLGMNPVAAFPIMMGSCAYLMPVCSARFLRTGRYHPSAAVALTLAGIPALLIAAFVVKSLPITAVRWVVVVVVVYTGTMLLRAALGETVGSDNPEGV